MDSNTIFGGMRTPGAASRPQQDKAGGASAWEAARRYGCDMSLLEENLAKTPAERIAAHRRALSTVCMLRDAVEKRRRQRG